MPLSLRPYSFWLFALLLLQSGCQTRFSRHFQGLASYQIDYVISDSVTFTAGFLEKNYGSNVYVIIGKGNYLEHYNNGVFSLYRHKQNLSVCRGVNDDSLIIKKASSLKRRNGELKSLNCTYIDGKRFRAKMWQNRNEESVFYYRNQNKLNPRWWRSVKFEKPNLLNSHLIYLPKRIEIKEEGYTAVFKLDFCQKQFIHPYFFYDYFNLVNRYADFFRQEENFLQKANFLNNNALSDK